MSRSVLFVLTHDRPNSQALWGMLGALVSLSFPAAAAYYYIVVLRHFIIPHLRLSPSTTSDLFVDVPPTRSPSLPGRVLHHLEST